LAQVYISYYTIKEEDFIKQLNAFVIGLV